ncbi:MAG: hypothetical protein IJ519_00745 [Clostridia bacterium]|nr:hypothetical protein [Clostridia bacterium]
MKKRILLILSLLLLTGCGGKAAVTEPTEVSTEVVTEPTEPVTENPYAPIGDENTFLLPELPDIGEYEADELDRWQDGPMPELIPSDKYGRLHPYVGDVKEYSAYSVLINGEMTVDQLYYGLCTDDGTLVTDPVYTSITHHDGCYLLVTKYADKTMEIYSRAYIAAEDGSAVTLIHDGEGVPQYYAPDVYGVIDGADIGAVIPFRYLHSDGTEYDTDIRGVIEYEHGFLLFRQYDNGFSDKLVILDKDLHPIGDYIYRETGAEGEIIAYNDDGFVILDPSGKVRYSTDNILFYDGGYMIKTDEKELAFLREDMSVEKTVTYPTEIRNVTCGYVKGRDWYYTFSGEQTEYYRIEYKESSDTYLLTSEEGTLIKSGDEEFFFKSERKITNAVIYDHAVAVRLEDGYGDYLIDREDGKLIDRLNSFDRLGYTPEGDRQRSYTVPAKDEYTFRAQNGVFTTFTPDGKVLVKIHSDTE